MLVDAQRASAHEAAVPRGAAPGPPRVLGRPLVAAVRVGPARTGTGTGTGRWPAEQPGSMGASRAGTRVEGQPVGPAVPLPAAAATRPVGPGDADPPAAMALTGPPAEPLWSHSAKSG